jgi:hypothetical protein
VRHRRTVDVDGVRLARPADAPAIAALQADSWRHTYRGFLPDAHLDHEVFDDRAAAWQRRFRGPQHTVLTLIAEGDGAMLGFARSHLDHDPEWGTLLVRSSCVGYSGSRWLR